MTRSIRIAAMQLRARDRAGSADGWQRCLSLIEEAARRADLVVLPEATIPAYVLGDDRIDDAAVERAIESLRVLAQATSTAIVAGVAQRQGTRLRNRALAIDRDGSIAGHADKVFLWHFDRKWFEAGNAIAPVETSLGRLGLLVCADGRMPGIAAALADAGAELLVMPTAWVTSGRDARALENAQADLLARVRAFENGLPFAAANKCGVEGRMVAYCGKSQIVDERGEIAAFASEQREEAIYATVRIGATAARRGRCAPAFAQRGSESGDPFRLMISMDDAPADIGERLAILDDAFLLGPHSEANVVAQLDARMASVQLDDGALYDPRVGAACRAAGCRMIRWHVSRTSPWVETIARARGMELRMYVLVFDREADRAFAVDPDGAIVAGTYGEYRMASVAIDPRRTAQTMLVPGTDVAAGIELVASIVASHA